MSNSYVVGAVARLTLGVVDGSGTAADPGTLRLKYKDPSGVVTTWIVQAGQIVKDSTGNYHADVTLNLAGTWRYRWEADAPNPGAVEDDVVVSESYF